MSVPGCDPLSGDQDHRIPPIPYNNTVCPEEHCTLDRVRCKLIVPQRAGSKSEALGLGRLPGLIFRGRPEPMS